VAVLPLLLLAGLPGSAGARVAEPDTTFLKTRTAEVQHLAAAGVEAATSPRGALDAIRKVLLTRDGALGELGARHSLTSFDGIETQDRYDREVVLALGRVAVAGVAADSTLPAEGEAVQFNEALGSLPQLGDTPVAFMVLAVVEKSIAAADSLHHAAGFPARDADKLALRLIRHVAGDYEAVQHDFLRLAAADSFRQSSVVMRMRCPKDGGIYRLTNMKNKIAASGEISRLYYLQCSTCSDVLQVEFPLPVASRLNEVAPKQKLAHPPQAKEPSPGPKP
jgi:hypothetical protein